MFFINPIKLLRIIALISISGGSLVGAEIEGYWKFTEKSIQEITDFTLKSSDRDPSEAGEISKSYRNHIREFKLDGDHSLSLRMISFGNAGDRYPEVIRKFDLSYLEYANGDFLISAGSKEVFTGNISGGILNLKDSGSGNNLQLNRISEVDYPYLSEKTFVHSELDRRPKAKKFSAPEYPPALKNAGISGIVEIEFKVNTDGTTSEIQVVSSPHDGLSKSAIEAIRTSTFHPGRVDRKPVRTHVKLPITFR